MGKNKEQTKQNRRKFKTWEKELRTAINSGETPDYNVPNCETTKTEIPDYEKELEREYGINITDIITNDGQNEYQEDSQNADKEHRKSRESRREVTNIGKKNPIFEVLLSNQTIYENAIINENAYADEVLAYLLLQDSGLDGIESCYIGDDVQGSQTPDIYSMERDLSYKPYGKKWRQKFGIEVRRVEEGHVENYYSPAVSLVSKKIFIDHRSELVPSEITHDTYINRIAKAISQKFKKLRHGNYSGCEHNFLFIFSNLTHKDNINEDKLQEDVFNIYQSCLNGGKENFEALFVCINNKIFTYTPEMVYEIKPANIDREMNALHEMCDNIR